MSVNTPTGSQGAASPQTGTLATLGHRSTKMTSLHGQHTEQTDNPAEESPSNQTLNPSLTKGKAKLDL